MNTRLQPEPCAQDAARPSLVTVQKRFCRYLRDPDNHPAPEGLNKRRLDVYRDLIFNNVESLLGSAYPVVKAIMGKQWQALVREFFVEHRATTPHFTRLAAEFLQFLAERAIRAEQPGFLNELARHEWLELELLYREDSNPVKETVPFSEGGLVLSSLVEIAEYRYPVHQLSENFLPESPPDAPTYLLMYRDHADQVVFFQLSDLAFQLLSLIGQHPGYRVQYWLDTLASSFAQSFDSKRQAYFVGCGQALLEQFYESGVLQVVSIPQ